MVGGTSVINLSMKTIIRHAEKIQKYLSAFLFCLVLVSIQSKVARAEQEDSGIGIYLDQDMFVPFYNEDRDYTMGIAFEFFWEKDKGLYPLDGLVRSAGKWLGMDAKDNQIVYSFMLGTVAFTPDELANPDPIYDDRPYSSLIYLSNKRVRADHKNAIAAEVLLGLLGTGLTESVQTGLHTTYRELAGTQEPVNPEGWDHQVSDGGELTFRLRLSNSRLKPAFSIPGTLDVATSWGVSLGYQTNASAAIAVRSGNIKSPFWSLPFDPVNRGNFLPSRASREWYLWSALRVHYVVYDALLQGQFRKSDVVFESNEIERLVYDGGFGLSFGFDQSTFAFSVNAKSSELKITDRRQVWGGVHYLYHF